MDGRDEFTFRGRIITPRERTALADVRPPPPEPPFLRALPSARPTDTELMARAVAEPDVFATLFDRHAAAVSAVTETAGDATCGQRR
jgi:hypothetical protein